MIEVNGVKGCQKAAKELTEQNSQGLHGGGGVLQ